MFLRSINDSPRTQRIFTMSRPTQSTKAQTWKQHFADFKRSQLTVAQFCQSIGCSIPTFYLWKRKFAESKDKVAFLRVQSTDAQSTEKLVKLNEDYTKVRDALAAFPNGESIRQLREAVGMRDTRVKQIIEEMVEQGEVEMDTTLKHTRKVAIYRLKQIENVDVAPVENSTGRQQILYAAPRPETHGGGSAF